MISKHANRGKEFEASLAATHQFYLNGRIVDVIQTPNAWEFAKGGDWYKSKMAYENGLPTAAITGDGRYLVRSKSDVDFAGGGFVFDAKQTQGKSFPLAKVSPAQVNRLFKSSRCGSVAGLMVWFSELGRVFFVPAAFLNEKYSKWETLTFGKKKAPTGTASISLKEMEFFCIEIPKMQSGLWHWYEKLLEFSEKNYAKNND